MYEMASNNKYCSLLRPLRNLRCFFGRKNFTKQLFSPSRDFDSMSSNVFLVFFLVDINQIENEMTKLFIIHLHFFVVARNVPDEIPPLNLIFQRFCCLNITNYYLNYIQALSISTIYNRLNRLNERIFYRRARARGLVGG